MRNNLGLPGLAAAALLASCSSGGGRSDAGSGGDPTPVAGLVADGLGSDIDMQTSVTTLSANWSGFTGNAGPIARYEWAIGKTPQAADIQGWVSVDMATAASNTQLSLTVGTKYFVTVHAIDTLGNTSTPVTTDGVEVTGPGGGGGNTLASSVGQAGITWQFDHEYSVGQFCNGDWWVVGPVTIVGITPQCQTVNGRVINGSMINPPITGRQGYDSAMYGIYGGGENSYFPSTNVAANLAPGSPLLVQPSSSLISSVSDPSGGNGFALQSAAVLTVLAVAPPADAFRPGYSGADKTIRYRESQLDYGALAMVTPATGAPTMDGTAEQFQRVWLDHCTGWVSQFMHPLQNMPGYYRDFTALTGTAGLMLNCNYTNAQKRDLLVRFTQIGIDHYGNIVNGLKWNVNGHCNGRKFPILFAGRVLNDSAMLAAGVTYQAAYFGPGNPNNIATTFAEDGQTFYVEQTSPGVYNWGHGGYNATHVGIAEWGNFHTENPAADDATWDGNAYRRCCSANGWVGPCLTMRMMGIQSAWNQQAWFDYMDRYMQIEENGSWTEAWVTWHGTMWNTYRAQF